MKSQVLNSGEAVGETWKLITLGSERVKPNQIQATAGRAMKPNGDGWSSDIELLCSAR